jgi:hypothetical protein
VVFVRDIRVARSRVEDDFGGMVPLSPASEVWTKIFGGSIFEVEIEVLLNFWRAQRGSLPKSRGRKRSVSSRTSHRFAPFASRGKQPHASLNPSFS